MKINFWGVVGSCPGRDIEMSKIASNTSCVSVTCDDKLIIFDAGSGIVQLAKSIKDIEKYTSIDIYISHYHYDHVIGIPFATLFYNPNLKIKIHGPMSGTCDVERAIKGIFVKPYLPMAFSALKADISFENIDKNYERQEDELKISCMDSDHPGGNLIYRIEYKNKSFSYLTDLGHSKELDSKLVDFTKESDLIYYDANFLAPELDGNIYEGWGHSTHEKGIGLLYDSLSKKIALGHHAMHRSASDLLELEKKYNEDQVLIARDAFEIIL